MTLSKANILRSGAGPALALGLAVAAVPALATPTSPIPAGPAAPAIILVSGGCGWNFHRDFRGFCRPNFYRGFYRPYRPYGWGGWHRRFWY